MAVFEEDFANGLFDSQGETTMAVLQDVSKTNGKPKLTAHQVQEALARRQAGEALAEIGRSFNVSHSTINWL